MNVLILGKDQRLFADGPVAFGDTRTRHVAYARALARLAPESSVRVVARGIPGVPARGVTLSPELRCWATRGTARLAFLPTLPEATGRALADGWRPDVITTQEPWEEGHYGLWLARRLGAQFLPQFHFDPFAPAWRAEHWANPVRFALAMATAKRADRVRVVASGTRQGFIGQGLDPARVWVVPVGIAYVAEPPERRSHWHDNLFPQFSGRPKILFVGRFYPLKDLPVWIETAHRIAASRPDAAFILVGDGPLMQTTRDLVAAAGLAQSFAFPGAVAFDGLAPYYAAGDVFLLSSNYEAWGRVIVEAQMSGCPVVSTNASGPMDLIEDGRTGLLAPIGDAAGLADRVLTLLNHPDQAARLAETARKHAETHYSMTTLAENVARFWLNRPKSDPSS